MLFESSTPSASAAGAATCGTKPISFISGTTIFARENDAGNLLTACRPLQPTSKLLDRLSYGNSTTRLSATNIDSNTIRMIRPM